MLTDPVEPEVRAPTGEGRTPPPPVEEPTLDDLVRQHRSLDAQLEEMSRRLTLSPMEQLEAARMKKRKLWLKDRIAALSHSP